MIGIKNEDGTVTGIYCHWDGYPENNGQILVEHYRNEKKVRELIDLGDLSILGPEIGIAHDFESRDPTHKDMCTAYGRDRGEKDVSKTDFKSERDLALCGRGQEFSYVFDKGDWFLVGRYNRAHDRIPVVDILKDTKKFYEENE